VLRARIQVVGLRAALSIVLAGCVAPAFAPALALAGQVALRPAAGAPGTPVVLEAVSFPASAPVRVGVAGRTARTVRSSATGAFTARLTVPADRHGTVAIVARSGRTRVVSDFVTRRGQGADPVVEVASSRGGRVRAAPVALVPGATLVLRGAGLGARRRLVVSWVGARRTVTTSAGGRFTIAIAVPGAQAAGRWPALVAGRGLRLSFGLDVLARAIAGSPPAAGAAIAPGTGAPAPVAPARPAPPPSPPPRPGPPVNGALPVVSGAAAIGQTLTATTGAWTGTAPIRFAFAWQRCNATGAACTAISRATGSTYAVAAADAGRTLRVAVTASNAAGSATATSAATALVPAPPPATGVVALWHMDETAGAVMHDAVGGHDGTLSAVTPGVPGFAGTAFGFAGAGFVSVPSAAALNPGAADLTVTIHLNSTSVPATPDWDLIRKGLFTTVGGEFKVEYQPTGQASCGFAGSAGSSEIIAGPALNDGAWHTVQCTKTASSIRLVVDGRTFSQAANVGTISNDAPVVIGARPGSEFFRGSLDEASIRTG
jgi:Concanavalin A-like lectin/glucanases superfamily